MLAHPHERIKTRDTFRRGGFRDFVSERTGNFLKRDAHTKHVVKLVMQFENYSQLRYLSLKKKKKREEEKEKALHVRKIVTVNSPMRFKDGILFSYR